MGTDKEPSITSYVRDYRKYNSNNRLSNSLIVAQNNIFFGTDSENFKSTYKNDYFEKQGENAELNKDIIKDLRMAHYTLGNEPSDYQTIHKKDYVNKKITQKNYLTEMTQKMKRQNFRYGDDKMIYQTCNREAYKKRIAKSIDSL